MNLKSKVNIRFTFNVTIGLYPFFTNIEYCAKHLTILLTVLRQTDI